MTKVRLTLKTAASAVLRMFNGGRYKLPNFGFTYNVKCVAPDGTIRWEETVHNVVCTNGVNDLLDKYFAGSGYTAAWYTLLAGAGSKVAGDTLASHAGWSEVTSYSGNRPLMTWSAASSASKSANIVTFTINVAGPVVVAGAGICTVATGTAGVLFGVVDFSASRTVYLNDQIQVTSVVSQ